MATETQKNFRKQMAQIEKELAARNKEQYFSYIENEHIDSYYRPKKKRKFAAVSMGSIITTVIIIYSVYSWVLPFIAPVSKSNKAPLLFPTALNQSSSLAPIHRSIAEYLNSIQAYDNKVNNALNLMRLEFGTARLSKDSRAKFNENISRYKAQVEECIIALNTIGIPQEMSQYHNIMKQKYDVAYEEIIHAMDIVNSENNTNVSHLKFLSEKYNLLSKQQFQQMLAVFDKVNIKYKQDGNKVQYWYSN